LHQVTIEDCARARAEFRKFEASGNFLFSRRGIAIALMASLLAYLIFQKWWILPFAFLLLLDLTRKEGIREGYLHGFEFGMEHGYLKTHYPDDFESRTHVDS